MTMDLHKYKAGMQDAHTLISGNILAHKCLSVRQKKKKKREKIINVCHDSIPNAWNLVFAFLSEGNILMLPL